LRYEPDFLTGSYLAFRYEGIHFPEFDDDIRMGAANEGFWDNDVNRYSIAAGYKIQRDILVKVVYFDQKTADVATDPDDSALQATLTITF
jgi:hypothetical protein